MDASDPRLPQLLSLRAALYSPAFRSFVQDVTACGPLTDRVDCSCNLYVQGSHLLCHDDVIGTRRVSYIVYLSEPDEGWAAEDGGALELFPLVQPGEPAMNPTVSLLPAWNSMTCFVVQPGVSFHSVQEVFAPSKLRLSISGWFHAPAPPPDAQLASLNQLTALEEGAGEEAAAAAAPPSAGGAFLPLPDLRRLSEPARAEGEDTDVPPALTPAERELLQSWVREEYLDPALQAKVARRFRRDSSLQLARFLLPSRFEALQAATREADEQAGVGRGAFPDSASGVEGCPGWAAVGPPHKQRFLTYTPPAEEGGGAEEEEEEEAASRAGRLLHQLSTQLLRTPAFAALLWRLTGLRPTSVRALPRRFRPGSDYSVAHYGALTGPGAGRLDVSLACVADGEEEEAEAWACGDVGGFECYLQADEQPAGGLPAAAADVYRVSTSVRGGATEEDEGTLLNVFARSNTLSLVHRCVRVGACPLSFSVVRCRYRW